jgi:hypothetical protein
MAAPLDPAKLDDAIQRYLAREPLKQIKAATGVSSSVLNRERIRRGIPPRPKADVPWDDLISAYEAGESEYSLSQRFGAARTTIRPRLEAAGVQIRDRSSAGLNRAAKMTREERLAQLRNAHAVWREPVDPASPPRQTPPRLVSKATEIGPDGKRHYTGEFKVARAKLIEQAGRYDSPGEMLLGEALTERGLLVVPQKAIGKYNVDLAVAPVAVEVLGGGWHSSKRRTSPARQRSSMRAGTWCSSGTTRGERPGADAADYLVAFVEEVRRNPPAVSQYRVITGNGELLAAGSADDDEFPLVPPPRGRLMRGA